MRLCAAELPRGQGILAWGEGREGGRFPRPRRDKGQANVTARLRDMQRPTEPGAGPPPASDPAPGPSVARATSAYYEGKATLSRPRSNRAFQKEMHSRHHLTKSKSQMVFVMVGLPARGKSFISRRLESFLLWKGHNTRVFNVGKYRREAVQVNESGKSDFFDPNNAQAKAQREAVAEQALEDMLSWLTTEGEIGIFDATNSTEERRQKILRRCREAPLDLGIVFIETLCTNKDVLEENMRCKVAGSPDFAHLDEEVALADLRERIAKYEAVYETIEEDVDYSYIKLYNLSSRVLVSGCYGRMAQSILPYLMAIHIGPRPVWLARAGEGVGLRTFKTHSSIGSPLAQLTDAGKAFAEVLSDYVRDQIREFQDLEGDPVAIARRYSRNLDANAFVQTVRQAVSQHQREKELAKAAGGVPEADGESSLGLEHPAVSQGEGLATPAAAAAVPGQPLEATSLSLPASPKRAESCDPTMLAARGAHSGVHTTGHSPAAHQQDSEGITGNAMHAPSGCGPSVLRDDTDGAGPDGHSVLSRRSSADCSRSPSSQRGDRERGDNTRLRRSRRITKKWQDSVVRTANGLADPRAQLKVLTSSLPRGIATVEKLRTPCSREEYFMLTPLDKGSYMGLSMDEIKDQHPHWYERYQKDHLSTRFPGGECYRDLMNRLESVLIEIEQQTMPVLVVSHVSVLQVLLCYFLKRPIRDAPSIEVPLHTVIELQPTIGGPWIETRTELVPSSGAGSNGVGARTESAVDMAPDGCEGQASPRAAHGAAGSSTGATDSPPSIKKNLVSLVDLASVAPQSGANSRSVSPMSTALRQSASSRGTSMQDLDMLGAQFRDLGAASGAGSLQDLSCAVPPLRPREADQ